MGRDTAGVRGMNVSSKDNKVLAMDVARDDQDLLVVTENGYGKRTSVAEYRKTKARRDGREDDHAHRPQGRPRGRAGGARARGARVHLAAAAWCSAPPCAASTATAAPRRACA